MYLCMYVAILGVLGKASGFVSSNQLRAGFETRE